MMNLANPAAIDAFIAFILNHNTKAPTQSRTKLPCTYCGAVESTTWRPGPCGPSTLCNTCGVKYMDSGKRNRQIDLIMKRGVAVWVKKDPTSWMWVQDKEAPTDDPRVTQWMQRESVRMKLMTDLNPPPLKKMRL